MTDRSRTGSPPGGRKSFAVLRRILSFVRPHALPYAAGILGIAFANLFMNVIMARVLMDLTQGIMALSERKLAITSGLMMAATLFMVGFVFLTGYTLVLCMYRTSGGLREAVFARFVELPMEELEARHSGDLDARATTGIRQVHGMLMAEVQVLMSRLFAGVGSAVYMLKLDPRMGAAGILCGVVPLLVSLPFVVPMRETGRQIQERQAVFMERISDILRGRETVRHLNLAEFAGGRASVASRDLRAFGMRQVMLESGRKLADSASILSALGFLIYAGYLGVRSPSLIPTAVAAFQLSNPVRNLFSNIGDMVSRIQASMGAAERVVEILDLPPEPRVYASPSRPARDSVVSRAEIPLQVDRLGFRYSRATELTLRSISFAAAAGRRIALVGPSGGGKSTLVKVILGIYPPGSGEIRAFGRSIFETPLDEWRALFSYVPQNAFVFDGSVYDNIVGGLDDPGPDAIERAARMANAHTFIVGLPEGYRSRVSERGTNLSGGQKQRIAIARALMRDAPLLILDEATASLDTESESLVQEALDRLMAERTTLVVAHRLSTVRGADEILFMEDGAIAERGRHEDLMAAGGKYRTLVEESLEGRVHALREG